MIVEFIELIGLVIKIIFLSSVYTTFIFIVLYLIQRKTNNAWLENRKEHKVKNWLFIHFLISLSLFIYSFSYWQDTGFGESPCLPIGYGQKIYSPDYESTNFFPDLQKTQLNKDELNIDSFIISNNILCAEVSHEFSDSPKFDFIVCNLPSKTNQTFLTETDYNEYAKINGLPLKDKFYDFKTHYKEYLDNKPKWKKWLLP
jgi:hypothetical protein